MAEEDEKLEAALALAAAPSNMAYMASPSTVYEALRTVAAAYRQANDRLVALSTAAKTDKQLIAFVDAFIEGLTKPAMDLSLDDQGQAVHLVREAALRAREKLQTP